MKVLKFAALALIVSLFLLLVFLLPTIVQGSTVKNAWTPQNSDPVVFVTNPDRTHPSSTRLTFSSQVTYTPVATVYLPLIINCWQDYERESENPAEYTVGQLIYRSNASNKRVHGQFGATPNGVARPGYVKYIGIKIPQLDHIYLSLRYSKHSASEVPIQVYIDSESTPRATFYLENQENWNKFTWKILAPTDDIDLGSVVSGTHSIKFYTDGQNNGVADLDRFVLKSCLF